MDGVQPGVFPEVPEACRYLTLGLVPGADPAEALEALEALREEAIGDQMVVGLGPSLVSLLRKEIPGLRPFPSLVGPGVDIPATPSALWIWLRGSDRGKLVIRTNELRELLASAFRLDEVVDGFKHDESPDGLGRDLTGYEDGTENPDGEEAVEATVLQGAGPDLDGSTFVAAQKWVHELSRFRAMSPEEQDDVIGRRRSDNEELDAAPESAHVKRSEQEGFAPEAFVLRRSMPWADADQEGLVFVAFGRSLDAFEVQLTRMSGLEDGIVDALFTFSRPVTGGYFWCPPVKDGKLNLAAVGL
jgi:putative iron-dependent peroxidase